VYVLKPSQQILLNIFYYKRDFINPRNILTRARVPAEREVVKAEDGWFIRTFLAPRSEEGIPVPSVHIHRLAQCYNVACALAGVAGRHAPSAYNAALG
jgi:hypothetical protein